MESTDIATSRRPSSARMLVLRGLALASLTLLATGATAPLLTTERLYFFSNTFSLVSGLRQLVAGGELLIAALIGLFCLCVPVLKAAVIWIAASGRKSSRAWLLLADRIGKWSMLEVFVAALLIIALKLGPVADATLHYGAWLLAASVLMSGLASQWLAHAWHPGPILSGRVALTAGAVGGALAATVLIGIMNPAIFRWEAIVGTPETRCVARVLRLDQYHAAVSDTQSEYVGRLDAIDAKACPERFREAFGDYVAAWERLAAHDSAEQTEPGLLETAGAWLGIVATREDRVEDIEEAWADVERAAGN